MSRVHSRVVRSLCAPLCRPRRASAAATRSRNQTEPPAPRTHTHRRGVYIPGKNTLTNNTGYEHPRRTAAPGGGGGLSPIPRGVVCGPCARRPGAKFRGHARATLPICDHAPPAPGPARDAVRRDGDAFAGGGARERSREQLTAGKRIMTHTHNARFFRFSGWNPLRITSRISSRDFRLLTGPTRADCAAVLARGHGRPLRIPRSALPCDHARIARQPSTALS